MFVCSDLVQKLLPFVVALGMNTAVAESGYLAPSLALGESLAEFRRAQGYEIPKTEFYIAVNDCSLLGKRAIIMVGNVYTQPATIIDCEHPRDSWYRSYHGLIADVPVEVLATLLEKISEAGQDVPQKGNWVYGSVLILD